MGMLNEFRAPVQGGQNNSSQIQINNFSDGGNIQVMDHYFSEVQACDLDMFLNLVFNHIDASAQYKVWKCCVLKQARLK